MKTTLMITDLMNELCPDELGVQMDPFPVSISRVTSILQERGILSTSLPQRKRKSSRFVTRLVIAALFVVTLSVAAYAVYQAQLKDYFVTTPQLIDKVLEDIGQNASSMETLSLNGYQGTPEYAACTEWESWLAEHHAEFPLDDSLEHETPDNYYEFYDAAYQEQAEQLDKIIKKHGVRLHESCIYANTDEIYAMLGTGPFISDEYEDGTGYIYNDGTLKLDFAKIENGLYDLNSIFVGVKGTITMIYSPIDISSGYEEWSYQTSSGQTVDLVITPTNSHILFETESAYIHVSSVRVQQATMDNPHPQNPNHTRDSLEALADSIDFGRLAEVYDGTSINIS